MTGMKCGTHVVSVQRQMDNLNKLSRDLNKLKNDVRKTFKFNGNVSFSYEEQELIRRVIKSVFSQMKRKRDRDVAKTILDRTEWIDEL